MSISSRELHSKGRTMASISTASSNTEIDLVLVEEKGSVRTFILNRPKQLNAVSLPMALMTVIRCATISTSRTILHLLRLSIINKCFSRRTIEEILSALEWEAAQNKDDWISSTIHSLKKGSPTSLKVSLRSIREGRLQGIGKCLIREYRMACNVLRGEVSKDFFDGCRAILLEKDWKPKWEPSNLELVSEDMVDHYFSKIEDWEDLQLPIRSNLPPHAIAKL